MNDNNNLNNESVKVEKPKSKVSVLIIVLLVVVLGVAVFFVYDTVLSPSNESENNNSNETNDNDKKDNDNNEEEGNTAAKIDESKPWVYDATYEYDVEPKSYTNSDDETYSMDDIIIPYINLNSTAATKANAEIKNLFIELADFFKEQLEQTKMRWNVADYKFYEDDDILSVIITTEKGGTDISVENYYTYNFDLKTGKLLTYEEIYKYVGFNSNNINEKVGNAITDEMTDTMNSDDYLKGQDFNKYNSESITNYETSISENSIRYFIDADKKLNIVVPLSIPAGRFIFDTIITIK